VLRGDQAGLEVAGQEVQLALGVEGIDPVHRVGSHGPVVETIQAAHQMEGNRDQEDRSQEGRIAVDPDRMEDSRSLGRGVVGGIPEVDLAGHLGDLEEEEEAAAVVAAGEVGKEEGRDGTCSSTRLAYAIAPG
jgi:hypothetical protein